MDETTDATTNYEPNFSMPERDSDDEAERRRVREDNWPEYCAKGFVPVPETLGDAMFCYGVENVYTGDPFDFDANRPLRHKPAAEAEITVYVSPAGLAHREHQLQEHHSWLTWLAEERGIGLMAEVQGEHQSSDGGKS